MGDEGGEDLPDTMSEAEHLRLEVEILEKRVAELEAERDQLRDALERLRGNA